MKKKNGYALILSLVVIALLLILSTTVLSLSTLAYKSTKKFEETNKLRLVAESGIEKGKVVLKNYLLVNTNRVKSGTGATFNYLTFNPYNINTEFGNHVLGTDLCYMVDDIKCTITFSPEVPSGMFYDVSTGRNISYIEIQAKAEKGLTSKTFSVILDKTAISNIYFTQIFNSSITVVDDITNSAVESANIKDTSKIDLSGNVYLQGSLINLFPNSSILGLSYNEGKIVVNSNSLKTKINTLGNSVDLFKNPERDAAGNVIKFPGWNDSTIKKLKILEILDPTINSVADPIHDLTIMSNPTYKELEKYVVFQQQKDPFTNVPIKLGGVQQPPTLVTYKVTSSDTNPISFKRIITGSDLDGSKPGIYKSIIDELVKRANDVNNANPVNPILTYTEANKIATDNYGKFYKLILVKGDLIIEDNNEENFVNYLIYCTGKVTFQGEAHLYNSSIFAKKLETDSISSGKPIELFGVNSSKASAYIIGHNNLSDFNDIDKMIINNYLINNLDGYADNLSYKIIQWK
jgi:type II secretory pathway pseudopilin PulG